MAEPNYALKVTLSEATVIRDALVAKQAALEDAIADAARRGEPLDDASAEALGRALDDTRRLLVRIGR